MYVSRNMLCVALLQRRGGNVTVLLARLRDLGNHNNNNNNNNSNNNNNIINNKLTTTHTNTRKPHSN